MSSLRLPEIQGIIISGYSHLVYSSYLFGSIQDSVRAKQWIANLVPKITHSAWDINEKGKAKKPNSAVNIAFTAPGLLALGLPQDSLLTFPQEFREGMAQADRSRRLGDSGGSDPSRWEVGGPSNEPVHLLIILQTLTENELGSMRTEFAETMAKSGIKLICQEDAHRLADESEPFGFQDGISQPSIAGAPNVSASDPSAIPTGEFILGYSNSYGILPPSPTVPGVQDFGANGSFLVFRKLQQDVAQFRRYFLGASKDATDCEHLMAKAVGRWKNGTPLTLSPDNDDSRLSQAPQNNTFGYQGSDAGGLKCPVGAHIRRSNPRDTVGDDPALSLISVNRHRLLRRGVFYGPPLPVGVTDDDGQLRGILFFCINSDIHRQFEFVQQSWVNNPKFGGLYDDPDPLVGDNRDPQGDPDKVANFTVPAKPLRRRLKQIPRFVTVKGGAYLFLPSLSALTYLSTAGGLQSA